MKRSLAQHRIIGFLIFLSSFFISLFSEAQTLRLTTEYYSPPHIDAYHQELETNTLKGSKDAFNKFSSEMIDVLMERAGYSYTIDLTSYANPTVNTLENIFALTSHSFNENSFQWIGPIAGSQYVFINTENNHNKSEPDEELKNYKIGVYMAFTLSNMLDLDMMPIMVSKINNENLLKSEKGYIDLRFNSVSRDLSIDATNMKPKSSQLYRYVVYHVNTSKSVIDRLHKTLTNMKNEGFAELIYAKYH